MSNPSIIFLFKYVLDIFQFFSVISIGEKRQIYDRYGKEGLTGGQYNFSGFVLKLYAVFVINFCILQYLKHGISGLCYN